MGPFARSSTPSGAPIGRITHAHFWMSGIATELAARHLNLLSGADVSRARRGQAPSLRRAGHHPHERLEMESTVARNATWVAATCTDEVFELMRMGRSRSRISVVPCGVDLDRFTPDGPEARRGAQHRIVSVGQFVPRKGFRPRHPRAAVSRTPNSSSLVVRIDPNWTPIRRRRRAARVGCRTRRRRPGAVLRFGRPGGHAGNTAFRRRGGCTPWYEPFGIVPLEAMACGYRW